MILPEISINKRGLADFRKWVSTPLVHAMTLANVGIADAGAHLGRPVADLDLTPSPLGQFGTAHFELPLFSALREGGGVRETPASTRHQGASSCPSRNYHASPSFVRPSGPVAIRLANRRWAVPPLVPVPQRSPAAALPGVRRSERQAMSPIAKSTPANATDLTTRLRGFAPRGPRFTDPAQHLLQRGFRVYPKTQEDTSCSRKS
jgi:hypothetical protein